MKRYSTYADSGLSWLEKIPSHWELKPNRSLFYIRKELVGDKSSDYTLLSLTLKGIIPRDMDNPQGKFPTDFDTYQVVEPGDLVFCLFDIDETPRTVGLARQAGMITGAYTVVRCYDPSLAEFLHYYYLSLDAEKRLRPVYTGLRKVIQKNVFLSMKSPVPPEEERVAIVKFLEKETARIDLLMAKQEQMIDLLKERRSALVTQTVSGQIDARSDK